MKSKDTPMPNLDSLSKWMPTIGVVGMLALQTQFVTISDFDAMSERILIMEKVLVRMEVHSTNDQRHDEILADHEFRIRSIELQ